MIKSLMAAGLLLTAASAAHAGPPHVLNSQVFAPPPAGSDYAVAPTLDAKTREDLAAALQKAGLSVVRVDQPHTYLVTVWTKARPICSGGCSALTGYDVGPLADHYRHAAMVAAQRTNGTVFDVNGPLSWATVLQSDGLSNRSGDYLPALLRYGSNAYARDSQPESPPRLSPPPPPLPNSYGVPG